jgi:hypothetical protein
MLKDGRVWKCIEVYYGEDEKNDTVTREYRIDGTSEIEGRICHNLCLGSKVIDHYYEEGPRVYRYSHGGWELLFDFSLSPGQPLPNIGGAVKVESVDTLKARGTDRRCLYYGLTTTNGSKEYWIEGIGSSSSGPYIQDIVIGSFLGSELLSVYDGDTCIFEADDLLANIDVNNINNNIPKNSSMQTFYDLQGHRLSEEPSKGMYIKDGRKYAK